MQSRKYWAKFRAKGTLSFLTKFWNESRNEWIAIVLELYVYARKVFKTYIEIRGNSIVDAIWARQPIYEVNRCENVKKAVAM